MLAYGLGDAGTGLAATQLGFYLFPFFICAAGLPAFIAGSLLTVSKVWDALNDPLIGWLSDHTRSRWGPRLPWMLTAALPLGISLAATWWVPPGDTAQRPTDYAVTAAFRAVEDLENFSEFMVELYGSGDLEVLAGYVGLVLIMLYALWVYFGSLKLGR